MGNGYKHHFQYQQQNLNPHKTIFLPMLCSRTAIKDVTLQPRLEESCASFSNDPLSPKIGCMGQVKRNNRIIGFPTTTSHSKLSLTTKVNNDVKYLKLKRLFSGRNLGSNNTSCAINSCRRREGTRNDGVISKSNKEVCVNIAEMDPPLPVIKRVAKPAADEEGEEGNGNNLWKRRLGGGALKSLELQQIKIPRHRVEITTV